MRMMVTPYYVCTFLALRRGYSLFFCKEPLVTERLDVASLNLLGKSSICKNTVPVVSTSIREVNVGPNMSLVVVAAFAYLRDSVSRECSGNTGGGGVVVLTGSEAS